MFPIHLSDTRRLFAQNVTAIKIMYQRTQWAKAYLGSWSFLINGQHLYRQQNHSFGKFFHHPECTQLFPSKLERLPRRERKECNYHVPYFALIRRQTEGGRGEENVDPFSGLSNAGINIFRLQRMKQTFYGEFKQRFSFSFASPGLFTPALVKYALYEAFMWVFYDRLQQLFRAI